MLLAAQTARKFWEQAGTWLQVEKAEYRLSMTYLQAGDPGKAWQRAPKTVSTLPERMEPLPWSSSSDRSDNSDC